MKKSVLCLITLAIIMSISISQGKTLDEYIKEAETYQELNNFDQAINTMEQAVKEHPDNSMAYTQLGIYISIQAQRIKGFTEVFKAIEQAFIMWDKAISLDPNNFTARFFRGGWAINMPKFTGQLEKGIEDMEFLTRVLEQSSDPAAIEQLLNAYDLLGQGYQKQGRFQKAKSVYEKLITVVPDTKYADEAKENINKIVLFEEWQAEREKTKEPDNQAIIELKENLKNEPDNISFLIALGKEYFDAENYEAAEKVLKQVISLDSLNVNAFKLLALCLGQIGEQGYDPRIYMDTDLRTNLVFEAMNVLDKAIALAPDDIEMRFMRGAMGVSFPFFIGKLDQGIEDLNMVIASDVPDSTMAEALYWIGFAYQKKARTHWIEIVSQYSGSEACQYVFNELAPGVKRIDLSKYKTPILVIDFILGFRDELAPQTAVWIEKKSGKFIKTIYVSGFSGYAKEKQVNLPMWTNSSKFADVDGVTSASIDLGHHIYVWDLKDTSGKKVKSGEYIVKVETAYWPSMQYQRVEAPIRIGKKERRVVVEEENLIPYLEVKYIP